MANKVPSAASSGPALRYRAEAVRVSGISPEAVIAILHAGPLFWCSALALLATATPGLWRAINGLPHPDFYIGEMTVLPLMAGAFAALATVFRIVQFLMIRFGYYIDGAKAAERIEQVNSPDGDYLWLHRVTLELKLPNSPVRFVEVRGVNERVPANQSGRIEAFYSTWQPSLAWSVHLISTALTVSKSGKVTARRGPLLAAAPAVGITSALAWFANLFVL